MLALQRFPFTASITKFRLKNAVVNAVVAA
jgi:hypothetical protein